MKIAVISDLHLGPGDRTDLFGHQDAEFLRFLDFLEANFERIVLLGDIWETLTAKLPWTPRQALEACRSSHPQIARRFDRPHYKYIHGNHDIVTGWMGAPAHWDIVTDGVRLHFTHGHMHDLLIRRARWLSEVGVCFGAWLRRFRCGAFYRLLEHLDNMATSANRDPERCTFQRWAFETARQRQADVIITGHTHIPTRSERSSQLFLNSGTCSYGRTTFLAIDTKLGDYRVCREY